MEYTGSMEVSNVHTDTEKGGVPKIATKVDPTLKLALRLLIVAGQNLYNRNIPNFILKTSTIISLIVTGILITAEVTLNRTGVDRFKDSSDGLPGVYQALSRMVILAMHPDKFISLINKLELFWRRDKYKVTQIETESTLSGLNKIVRIYGGSMFLTCSFVNFRLLYSSVRAYPVVWYDFCGEEETACFLGFYFYQAYAIYMYFFCVIGCDSLLFYLLIRAYCELKMISYGLEHLNIREDVNGDEESVLKELDDIIKHHNFILSYIKELNIVYSMLLVHQFWTCIYYFSTVLYVMSGDGFPPTLEIGIKCALLLSSIHLQLFFYCLGGQLIKEQTGEVFKAAYNTKWYVKRQPKFCKCVQIIMSTTKNPVIMTVAGLFDLNIVTFTKAVKTSISFFTAMQTLKK